MIDWRVNNEGVHHGYIAGEHLFTIAEWEGGLFVEGVNNGIVDNADGISVASLEVASTPPITKVSVNLAKGAIASIVSDRLHTLTLSPVIKKAYAHRLINSLLLAQPDNMRLKRILKEIEMVEV